MGQGAANLVSGALGGLPVTGVIVRSSTNVAAGAQTRASAVLHGVWVLVYVVALAGLIENIPLAALAGLLVHVGLKLVNPGHLRQVLRHGDLALYLVTLAGVVVFDLLTGVLAGIVLAVALLLRRTVWSGVHAERDGDEWRVVVEGVLTFLSVPRLSKVLGAVPPRHGRDARTRGRLPRPRRPWRRGRLSPHTVGDPTRTWCAPGAGD